MRRREFITLVGSAAAWPLSVRADKLTRIGLLQPSLDNPVVARGYPAFLEEMKKSGFSEGQNLTIQFVRLDQDSQSVVRRNGRNADKGRFGGCGRVRNRIAGGTSSEPSNSGCHLGHQLRSGRARLCAWLGAARRQHHWDRVTANRIGGEASGAVDTQAFPGRTRLGIFWDQISGDQFAAAERQARSLSLDVQSLKLQHPPYDFDAAFQKLGDGSPQMLLVLSSPFFAPARSRIAELAIRQRLPTMFIFKTYVEAGGLMSYGVNAQANYRQLGFYAAKILNGAKPADLPVQQAVQFELVINLKTAKAIGVDVSTAIQLRADEVIE